MSLEGKQFSHYRILHLIGKGGMGEVYLVEDIQVKRQVAAKVIRIETAPPEQEDVTNALRLYWREAIAIARLDHPLILPLYDHGEAVIDGSPVAYLIIPYRPEGSLATWLRKRAQARQTRQLTLKQVAHVIQQASQALQYAHDQHIMHLDVKPANFLIRSRSERDEYPDLLLGDFGIARFASATPRSSQQMRGTPAYMAPEQCLNQPVFASDQYALAVMAYELLTGSLPFQGSPMQVMFAHLHEQPKPAHDRNPLLPPAVDPVLQRALAKKPEERFPSVATFAQAFQQAFQGVDEATTLRLLRVSPATPPPTPGALSAGDVHTILVINTQEARDGAVRTITLDNGRVVNVRIPPGTQSGQVIIFIGQGEAPGPGTAAGNLYVTLSVVEAPVPSSSPTGDVASLPPSPQPASPLSPEPAFASPQELLPPTASAHADLLLQGPVPRSPIESQQAVILPQGSATLSPQRPSAQRKRWRSPTVFVALFLLTVFSLSGGILASTGLLRASGHGTRGIRMAFRV